MKMIFFTYDFPYPTDSGGKARAYNLLKFGKKDLDVYLFSFFREGFNKEYLEKIKELGISKIQLFQRKKVRRIGNLIALFDINSSLFKRLYFNKKILAELKKTIIEENIDLVHFESFYTCFYIAEELKSTGAKLIFGTENIEYKLYEDYAKYISPLPLKPFYYQESKKIQKEEELYLKNADLTLAVTVSEAEHIRQITNKDCMVIENGVDVEHFSFKLREDKKQKNILFVGNFSYFPNVDAVKYFYFQVFKKLKNEDVIFTIVGKNSTKLSFIKNDKRVKIIEFVKDIRAAYYAADIFISPLRFGGGTNFKVLEAMATGLPVIANYERVEALGAKRDRHFLNAENEKIYLNQIFKLISSKNTYNFLAENARKLVEEKYSWQKIGDKMYSVWNQAHQVAA